MIPQTVATNVYDGSRLEIQTAHPEFFLTLGVRAPQATPTSAVVTNTSPFFPDPSAPPASDGKKGGLAKSVLEYLFLGVALIVVASIILRRITKMKRRSQPITAFFTSNTDLPTSAQRYGGPRQFPRTTGIPPMRYDGQNYPLYPDVHLTGIPAAYMGPSARRTRAADVDANGRRLGDRAVELDHDGELGDKDMLPAYDNFGGPPKYVDLEMQPRLPVVGSGAPRTDVGTGNRLPGYDVDFPPPSIGTNLQVDQSNSHPLSRSSDLVQGRSPPTTVPNDPAAVALTRDGA
ncbi:hypothetical protein B0H34DRAFT_799791 [Crassisporium funariophilum]|nr:hypothetical protein B0H34DRAFT_799791 [Crassisporium funariophilum]